MKKLLVLLFFVCAVSSFAQDKNMWENMDIEQKSIFLIGFIYGVVTEHIETTGEGCFDGMGDLTEEDFTILINLTSLGLYINETITLRDAILTSLQVVIDNRQDVLRQTKK